METISATLTSKGQITLPKTIRDLMNLSTNDQVDFSIEPNGKVLIEKGGNDGDFIHNLLITLLKDRNVMSVTGKVATGKTIFVKKFLKSISKNNKIGIVDPKNSYSALIKADYSDLIKDDGMIHLFAYETLNIDTLKDYELDVIVMDERSQYLNLQTVNQITKNGTKVIIIDQIIKEDEIIMLGDHIMITANRLLPGGISLIEDIKIEEYGYSSTTLYKR